ncbi:MAG: ribonuclease N [Betaproteobacteria bacterium]|nr:ribonuclease N [Betaproteobacteria bacterium]
MKRLLLLFLLALLPFGAQAFLGFKAAGYGEIPVAQLPPEAQQTLALIQRGGPYPHAKDGTVFGNREGLLPKQTRGFYREFTVSTPGARDRGARRIVMGGEGRDYWYTTDHYRSFRRIRE